MTLARIPLVLLPLTRVRVRFRLQRVASLAAEARTLLGEDRLSEGEDSPLRRARNPRDLALLVKRYRLLEVSVSRFTELPRL